MIECEKKVDPPPVRAPTGGGQVEMKENDKSVSKRMEQIEQNLGEFVNLKPFNKLESFQRI